MSDKKKIEIYSNILEEGKLQKNVKTNIALFLIKHIKKRVLITIEIIGSKRSDRQNRYYWGCVINCQIDCFKERWGEIYDATQIHDWNKSNIWNTEYIDEETGEIFKIPGTSKTTVSEFEYRLEKLRQFFQTKFDWKIPLPNEQTDIKYE